MSTKTYLWRTDSLSHRPDSLCLYSLSIVWCSNLRNAYQNSTDNNILKFHFHLCYMNGAFSDRLEVQTQTKFTKISKNLKAVLLTFFKEILAQLLDN
jgi:hypothetical protein